jgi:hypothetical protein
MVEISVVDVGKAKGNLCPFALRTETRICDAGQISNGKHVCKKKDREDFFPKKSSWDIRLKSL